MENFLGEIFVGSPEVGDIFWKENILVWLPLIAPYTLNSCSSVHVLEYLRVQLGQNSIEMGIDVSSLASIKRHPQRNGRR